MNTDLNTKKRMMFIMSEDYNFLAYNIFIILNGLGCTKGKSSLKDHRKLSFIIDFVSDHKLIDIIEKRLNNPKLKLNEIDRDILNQSYTNSLLRLKTINQLIYTLSSEELIEVTNKKLDKLSISLIKESLDKDFFKGSMFKIERDNLKRLKTIVQRITIIDITNLLTSLYYKHGILNEQIIN